MIQGVDQNPLNRQIKIIGESFAAAIARGDKIGTKSHPFRKQLGELKGVLKAAQPIARRPWLDLSHHVSQKQRIAYVEISGDMGWRTTDRLILWLLFSPSALFAYLALLPYSSETGDASSAAWNDDDTTVESGIYEGYPKNYAAAMAKFEPAVAPLRENGFVLEAAMEDGASIPEDAIDWDRSGNSAWKRYDLASLPGEDTFFDDLDAALEAMDRAIQLDGGSIANRDSSTKSAARLSRSSAGSPPRYAADGINDAEFDAMCAVFLRYYDDEFGHFTDQFGPYWLNERAYKDELAIRARKSLPSAMFDKAPKADNASAVITAVQRVLTKPLTHTGKPQNLVGWRYSLFLRELKTAEKAVFVRALGELLYSDEEEAGNRANRFTDALWPVYRRTAGRSNPYALARIFPTFFLMLFEPLANIAVRTDMFDAAARRLLGRRILRNERFSASEYREVLDFALKIRDRFEVKAWRPRDLIDVHSFLWVAREDSEGDTE